MGEETGKALGIHIIGVEGRTRAQRQANTKLTERKKKEEQSECANEQGKIEMGGLGGVAPPAPVAYTETSLQGRLRAPKWDRGRRFDG